LGNKATQLENKDPSLTWVFNWIWLNDFF
jgi:hypothetical protein